MFLAKESGSTKVPTHLSYDAWDCTALFQATIFSKSFSMPDGGGHHRTLSYLFVRPHRLPTGGFHASVISRTGNDAESFALAIDQLRLLRNAFCHSPSSEIPKATFNMYLQLTKETFQALGVSSSSVNAIGSLAEKDFPIGKVPELEDKIRKERQAEIAFLKKRVEDELISIRSENTEANQERRNEAERVVTVLREEIQQLETRLQEQNERHSEEMKKEKTELKETIRFDLERSNQAREKDAKSAAQERKETRQQLAEINQKLEEIPRETTKQVESNPSLPKSNLPSMVPYFTGREKECDEVFAHVTNKATHLVSIWGSPGFGKTSTAIAVGHRLQAQDLPIPNRCIFILDNADDLFESGLPNVKKDVFHFIEELVNHNDKVSFLLTTRESCEFLKMRFKGYRAVRIKELDEQSSSDLVQVLLPEASKSDGLKVAKKCGSVPLAMKLLCSLISEDGTETSSESINMFLNTSDNILEMLDNPDYPSNMRLKCLFDASFQKLSAKEKEALVSLSILPEHFDKETVSAVLGMNSIHAVQVLKRLKRTSLIDFSSKAEEYSIHKLILSFVQEKGESEMKETVLNSKKRALDIRLKALGEDHSQTADSYHQVGVTQHSLGDFVSALESNKHALDIRLKALGEDHSRTADSYHSLGVTQHSLGDLVSALESNKRALNIRLKALGEDHSQTAGSYHSLGATPHSLGDCVSALESNKRVLDIRLKALGEDHSQTADSYHSLGITPHSLGDLVSALESNKRALDIRLKALVEDHSRTADSYHEVGVTQHLLGDFVSALESNKRALDIRLKALGEDHSEIADSYDSLGVTQHSLGDFVSALESKKRALDIRLKALGEDHSQTAESYHSLGVTQRSLGDLVSALHSAKRALDIRIKVLGEEHSRTADSRFMVKYIEKSLSRNS
ncbi:Nephrocystin-3 [Stylophora pistillata]|uniref:Nephrocystin-3 n=1 Tax=Stylophora pistillata TaxID=50429 RepID=A0A2B4R245_STYPI|nr:Nephrocystin-3 [Stylophora pistillata]